MLISIDTLVTDGAVNVSSHLLQDLSFKIITAVEFPRTSHHVLEYTAFTLAEVLLSCKNVGDLQVKFTGSHNLCLRFSYDIF